MEMKPAHRTAGYRCGERPHLGARIQYCLQLVYSWTLHLHEPFALKPVSVICSHLHCTCLSSWLGK